MNKLERHIRTRIERRKAKGHIEVWESAYHADEDILEISTMDDNTPVMRINMYTEQVVWRNPDYEDKQLFTAEQVADETVDMLEGFELSKNRHPSQYGREES